MTPLPLTVALAWMRQESACPFYLLRSPGGHSWRLPTLTHAAGPQGGSPSAFCLGSRRGRFAVEWVA